MNHVLICKLGATGDVVRTTSLLHELDGHVTWITESKNIPLLQGIGKRVRCLAWSERQLALDRSYELVINLEDSLEVAALARDAGGGARHFGAIWKEGGGMGYTEDSKPWFDLSLISTHGRQRADQLKLENRRTYQDLLFSSLGLRFFEQSYVLPPYPSSDLKGDVAIAPEAGPVWPMKNWAYYDELKQRLEANGLIVNVLGKRPSLHEHLADVAAHRCLVGGDSLPMHFALGSGVRCVSLFNCTSPWEIHDYGIQTKIISPLLSEFFYQRGFDERATRAITVDSVFDAVMSQLNEKDVRRPQTWPAG